MLFQLPCAGEFQVYSSLVSVLFYVDKTLRDGEPRVWKELNAAWDAKFSRLPGGRPGWDGQRYGSILFGGELCDGPTDGTQMPTVQSMALNRWHCIMADPS